MRTLQSLDDITHVEDEALRMLIQRRAQDFAEFDDIPLNELVMFVLVEPGDSVADLDAQLTLTMLDVPFDVLEDHAGYYEISFVVSDDGYGIDVFVPKQPGVDPALLDHCAQLVAAMGGGVDP